MTKNKKIFTSYTSLLVIAVMLMAFVPASTSNPFEELKVLNDKYRTMKEYSMNISYMLYANYTTTKTEYTSSSHYVKKDKTIFVEGNQMQTLQTANYLVVVSLAEKKIFVSKPSKDVVQDNKLDVIQKALEKSSTLTVEKKEGKKIFNVNFKNNATQYEKMRITENTKTACLEKMELFIGEPMKVKPEDPKCKEEKPRMEVLFSELKTTAGMADTKLNESYYIIKKGDGFEPAPAFKNFKLINNYH
ncbi:MAG: hypothetical protein Q8M29_01250 [Bacteroidota bacterium]|nr:hypothetical protein [Bacteroidota bacterium]